MLACFDVLAILDDDVDVDGDGDGDAMAAFLDESNIDSTSRLFRFFDLSVSSSFSEA